MKKTALCLFVLIYMLFASCMQKPVEGGIILDDTSLPQDEETAAPQYEKVSVRLINIEGDLYYDTETRCTDITCGTLDYSMHKAADEFEVPKNDRECNFENTKGCQNYLSSIKVVEIGNEWILFEKINAENEDLLSYSYCWLLKDMEEMEDRSKIIFSNDKDADSNDEGVFVYIVHSDKAYKADKTMSALINK